jgi:AcrR family transcriptional regulator
MDRFAAVSAEKQHRIIEAALAAFGAMGYKKASMGDIAEAAVISKAALFQYFGTKKTFYMYLVRTCGDMLMNELHKASAQNVTDFFDKIVFATNAKIGLTKKFPSILTFLDSVYEETDPEVTDDLRDYFAEGSQRREELDARQSCAHKFRYGLEPTVVMKSLVWMAQGYEREIKTNQHANTDALLREFIDCMALMKRSFYRSEYQ